MIPTNTRALERLTEAFDWRGTDKWPSKSTHIGPLGHTERWRDRLIDENIQGRFRRVGSVSLHVASSVVKRVQYVLVVTVSQVSSVANIRLWPEMTLNDRDLNDCILSYLNQSTPLVQLANHVNSDWVLPIYFDQRLLKLTKIWMISI